MLLSCLPIGHRISADPDGSTADRASNSSVVVIDPGHGTRNARVGAYKEAETNLAVALKVKEDLSQLGIRAVLTHDRLGQNLGAKNPEQDNRIRAEMANRLHAALMVRLHCDASSGEGGVFYPRLHQNHVIARESRIAASYMSKELRKARIPGNTGIIKGDESTMVGGRQGGLLTGSKYSRVPVVLIEILPLNRTGISWIANPHNRDSVAQAISAAILETRHAYRTSK
jgi:N-acetylmuramoyl-L-alanine amidase